MTVITEESESCTVFRLSDAAIMLAHELWPDDACEKRASQALEDMGESYSPEKNPCHTVVTLARHHTEFGLQKTIDEIVDDGNLPLYSPLDMTRVGKGVVKNPLVKREELSALIGKRREKKSSVGVLEVNSEITELPKSLAITTTPQHKIPGKLPSVGIGKLAVEIAWEIETSNKSAATAKEVIKRLQKMAAIGERADVLMETTKHGVKWCTNKGKPKEYEVDACGKTLGTWRKSRA